MLIQKHFPKKEVKHQITQQNSFIKQEAEKQNANTVVVKGSFTKVDGDKMYQELKQQGYDVLSARVEVKNYTDSFGDPVQ